MSRTKAFISYSHKDDKWKNRLMTQLAVLENGDRLHVWSDTSIAVGDNWYNRIDSEMADSCVAILLVSADFLASRFIRTEEVPRLLKRHADSGMLLLPLIARPCAWELVPWLAQKQVRPKEARPLSSASDDAWETDLADFTREIAFLLNHFEQQSTAKREGGCGGDSRRRSC